MYFSLTSHLFTGVPELPRDYAEGALQPAEEIVQPLQRKPRGAVTDTAEGAGKHRSMHSGLGILFW